VFERSRDIGDLYSQGAQQAGVSQYEIVIADNGSTDGSRQIAESEGARVVPVSKRGYGAALIGGIQSAHGQYIVMADADDSYDWSDIVAFVTQLRNGASLVMGSRLKGKILPNAMPPLHRWLGNPILTFIGNLFFRSGVSDFHCGLRGFNTQAIRELDLHTTGMEFATEMVIKASMNRWKIAEVPITYYPDGRSRRPHLRTWRDGWRHLSFMMLLSPTWVFLLPGLVLCALGILGNLLILPAPFRFVAGIILDVHSLLAFNIGFLIGVELLTFWLVARSYASTLGILPPIKRWRIVTLNNGLLFGVLIMIAGVVPCLGAVNLWADLSFGELNYQHTLRLLIPGLTLIATGAHIVFASFVVGLIQLRESYQ
jgi:glycosyltransferase involved in cell wall biosynthesis